MRADALIFLTIFIKNLQLAHPINQGYKANGHKDPVNGVGTPPAVRKAQKVQWREKVVYK